MSEQLIVGIILALIGGGGIAAWVKMRPEAGQIVVKAAEKVVIIQSDEITRLTNQVVSFRSELDEAMTRMRALANELHDALRMVVNLEEQVGELRAELKKTRAERDALAAVKAELEEKVTRLEARVQELEDHA